MSIQPWDKERAQRSGFTYCHPCKGYLYGHEETREHMIGVHLMSVSEAENAWPKAAA